MSTLSTSGLRGPLEHERRAQIIAAAGKHFRHYGYQKTTVADLAKAIGLSKAYIYKFFESKQAIGEAVCGGCLQKIAGSMQAIAAEDKPATDRMRRIFRDLARQSADLFLHDRNIFDMASTSFEENWTSSRRHDETLLATVESVLRDGREAGEFERKTPLSETAHAVLLALQPFQHPALLLRKLDTLDDDAVIMANLVLRALVP
jgi:AcrR family transcriptional regulator